MATTREQMRRWQGPAVLSYGFRPFFLAGGLWAALSMALWLGMMSGSTVLTPAVDPISWHAHELLFGYLGAVVAGFLLTAVPNWTGRLPVVGWPLLALTLLWGAGRVAMALGALWPPVWVGLIDTAFLAAMALFLAREIATGRNWRNLVVLALLLALLAANALFHLAAAAAAGLRLGLAAAILLIAVIGGRVVPSFTRNWLVREGDPRRPAPPMQGFDRLALLALLAALLLWVARPEARIAGLALLAAGALHAGRLLRWQGITTRAEPLVWVLHLAYAFVPLGALGLGTALLQESTPLATASLHVWTVGAIGMMTLAVMTRATLGHTGAALHAGPATTALYLAIPAAVICRAAAALGAAPDLLYTLSGGLWIAAFLGFALLYGPRLMRRAAS
ncbi:NnrS family protein [Ovoidimarina sediminis]|uniref:NnrS family protein n=1 Tax=Ovoidimarina sediminis TaxID=3079856 RepID=UPI0029137565|nr:NnrS family protein [Rhodophyticola sp. MJ-SS7]MDU8941834.1 NnrS family protein [Rhodophyticola sp. MJ-SS7]